jgi:hypothetical protein
VLRFFVKKHPKLGSVRTLDTTQLTCLPFHPITEAVLASFAFNVFVKCQQRNSDLREFADELPLQFLQFVIVSLVRLPHSLESYL